ncbi:TadE/TadG family type IV pilus assembly protein [Bosea sp. (in: a-proteobacteria)]|uniref:TadE/TadG family type IV pilus assembly protein n=1 Tax=Bosea sp. (in: a-proteobacteria) TaxID=1871050 RepID=UPI002FCC6C4E
MALFRSFLKDARGSTALIFGLAVPALVLAVGGGIDLSRAVAQRQRIASAVELGCQQSTHEIKYRQNQANANPKEDYAPVVTQITNGKMTSSGLTGVSVSTSIVNNLITVNATGNSANVFGGVLGFENVSLAVMRNCTKPPFPSTPGSGTPGTVLLVESFETNHNVASNSWAVLNNWNGWSTQNGKGGIEINGIPQLSGNEIRFGNFFAELDSHCYTSNCKTNSAMWRDIKVPENGNYELRYWYISRVRNPAYGNQVICANKYVDEKNGNVARNTTPQNQKANWYEDVKWADWEIQTNRIEVYFDKNNATIPGSNFSNMVDVCVHTAQWSERIIKLTNLVKDTTYRFYFRAAGREDTYGGLIDYIRFCTKTCP